MLGGGGMIGALAAPTPCTKAHSSRYNANRSIRSPMVDPFASEKSRILALIRRG